MELSFRKYYITLIHSPIGFSLVFWFTVKTFFMAFIIIWVRWTFPRYRYDQLHDDGLENFDSHYANMVTNCWLYD